MPESPSVAEQADECGRERRTRERLYPAWVASGRLRPETAERKLAAMAAAERTLHFVAEHAAGLRALVHYLRAVDGGGPPPADPPAPDADETVALLDHPGVRGVLDAWPDAVVLGIRPLTIAPADDVPALEPATTEE